MFKVRPKYAPKRPKYNQRTPKVHSNYANSMSKVCIKYAQITKLGRSDSNQVLSNSTFTRSSSRTSPYQALVCPKIIISRLIGRAATCTMYILVSYLYQILFNFIDLQTNITLTFLYHQDCIWDQKITFPPERSSNI